MEQRRGQNNGQQFQQQKQERSGLQTDPEEKRLHGQG